MTALLRGFAAGALLGALACGLLPPTELAGQASRSCQTDHAALFNPCARLDTTQIEDRR